MKIEDKRSQYFVIFPRGGEEPVSHLLSERNLPVTESSPTFLIFEASQSEFYSFLLQCPFASRMGQVLAIDNAVDKNTETADRLARLDDLLLSIDWLAYLPDAKAKIIVKASSGLQIHEQITAKRAARYIVEPDFNRAADERHQPCPHVRIILTEDRILCGLDASESNLYQRLSPARGEAALKEHLAALVGHCGSRQHKDISLLLDPMCGSGTLLLESFANIAGLDRPVPRGLLIELWPSFDRQRWNNALDERQNLFQQQLQQQLPKAVGFDASSTALRAAQTNRDAFWEWGSQAKNLKIHLERRDLRQPWPKPAQGRAYIVMNPPYGKRLGADQNLIFFYKALGQRLQQYANELVEDGALPPVYTIISSNIELLDSLHLPYENQFRLYNGADPIFLRTGIIEHKVIPQRAPMRPEMDQLEEMAKNPLFVQDLAQRLAKNYKKIQSFLKAPLPKSKKGLPADLAEILSHVDFNQQQSESGALRLYRLYNADIPEYNCAIDVYEHCVYVQEYKAPAKVDPKKASHRLDQICHTLAQVMRLPPNRILLKSRERQAGKQQYKRFNPDEKKCGPLDDWHRKKHVFTMGEFGAQFIVNLADYIDTGLFLDHRKLRWLLQQISAQKHVLNLFSYTGSFSVHAALGGAASTTSVDLSPRYTAWTEHNFMANGIGLDRHKVIRADVMTWLQGHSNQYDLIIIDPPTFSNSKKADDFLVQENHEVLIRNSMRHLQGQGFLFFSCNMKNFTLSEALSQDYKVTDISAWTQSPDFQSKTGQNLTGGHRCWVLRHLDKL